LVEQGVEPQVTCPGVLIVSKLLHWPCVQLSGQVVATRAPLLAQVFSVVGEPGPKQWLTPGITVAS
jgi:hypothetical protein